MNQVLAFDIYGTLIDPHGVVVELEQMIGEPARAFSRRWREKQLEYTFRRGLMRRYADFSVCTRQALDYCDSEYRTELSDANKTRLMQCYAQLPAFADALSALSSLRDIGLPLYAFSNGTAEGVRGLLQQAGILAFFVDVISVDEIGSYKPDPAVYQHCLNRCGAPARSCWLVSSNPFDILGAANIGMPTAWIKRDPAALFDPWEQAPTVTLSRLTELLNVVQKHG